MDGQDLILKVFLLIFSISFSKYLYETWLNRRKYLGNIFIKMLSFIFIYEVLVFVSFNLLR
ncbi:hypothetical protein SNUCP2_31030 [Clostridium perfringens A]